MATFLKLVKLKSCALKVVAEHGKFVRHLPVCQSACLCYSRCEAIVGNPFHASLNGHQLASTVKLTSHSQTRFNSHECRYRRWHRLSTGGCLIRSKTLWIELATVKCVSHHNRSVTPVKALKYFPMYSRYKVLMSSPLHSFIICT